MLKFLKVFIIIVLCMFLNLQTNYNFVKAQTQAEMDNYAAKVYEKTDKELNKTLDKVILKYKSNQVFIQKLELAQSAWIKYRDAEIAAIYPEEDKSYYGSVYPVCFYIKMTELTQQRINELNLWLKTCEGDVCSGSRN